MSLPGDVPAITDAVVRHGAKLVVVDPITAFLDRDHSAYSNQRVRLALAPLAALARDHDCAVWCISHVFIGAGAGAIVGKLIVGFRERRGSGLPDVRRRQLEVRWIVLGAALALLFYIAVEVL